jgi:hypothetical protein
VPPSVPLSPVKSRQRSRWLLLAPVLAIVAAIAGFATLRPDDRPVPEPSSSPCVSPSPLPSPTASPADDTWVGTVVNTWSTSRCKDIGTLPRVSPLRTQKDDRGYFTGTKLTVTCYFSKGLPVPDKDTGKETTLFYRLDDGLWMSALFLQLPGASLTEPPRNMKTCRTVPK